jgi:hypothetical protein
MIARWLAAAALCAAPMIGGSSILFGPHHYPAGSGGLADPHRLTVSGAISDEASVGDDGALSLEMVGDVVLGVPPNHAGYTYCRGRCQLPAPTRSRAWHVAANTRAVVVGDWTAPSGASIEIASSSLLLLRGDLAGSLTLSVVGDPSALPMVLIDADAITASITAGTLPAGTALAISATQVALIEE